MNDNLKLTIGVLSMILVSLTLLFVFNEMYLSKNDAEKRYLSLLSSLEPDSKKIYLLGNSRLMMLNQDYIQKYLNEEGFTHKVYKLSIAGTQPQARLIILDKIISSNPDLVVFGVDITDFRTPKNEKPENVLFEPTRFLKSSISSFVSPNYFYDFKNPKLSSLGFIDKILPTNTTKIKNFQLILTHKELEVMAKANKYNQKFLPENNIQLNTIRKFNEVLTEQGIKFIIVVMPRPLEFINTIPEDEQEKFFNAIDDLYKDNEIKSISLFDKYAGLEIFQDHSHVTINKTGLIFSEDMAKIIIQELNP